ncbi:MAG: sulfite exporter TauE/SafE family protein [Alphaproteobacteria bacterium]|nr:sulfite exporter TauE/SafE family protein [Alphaproteobacteria bacterium]MCB9930748.1 sulfite exporter TauE/SafE family protein [Alphaproteobacteria bacterium]
MLDGIDPLVVAVVAVAFFLGGMLKGAIGLGMPLVAIPIIAIVMPVAKAIPLMVAPAYLMNIIQARESWHARTSLLPWWPVFIGIAVGVVIGVQFATNAPESLMRGILGVTMIVFVLLSFARIQLPQRTVENPVAGLTMGGLTGLFGGLTGVFGPTLAMYLLARQLDKDRFVWIMAVVLLAGVSFLGSALTAVGGFSLDQLLGTLGVLIPGWAGLSAGALIRRRVSQEQFRKMALTTLLIMGISLLVATLG